eukprot:6319561-Pyramimonas_sp.AAC.1
MLKLPSEALDQLAARSNRIEYALEFPQQVYLRIAALLPETVSIERPITITKCPTLYRLPTRLRGCYIQDWTDSHVAFWDAAVKKTSDLRAAMLREVLHECARGDGACSVSAHWDMENNRWYD